MLYWLLNHLEAIKKCAEKVCFKDQIENNKKLLKLNKIVSRLLYWSQKSFSDVVTTHFISCLKHKKNIVFITSGPEFRKTFLIQRPEIKFHENHETPVLNAKYKNCQKLNNSKLKLKK